MNVTKGHIVKLEHAGAAALIIGTLAGLAVMGLHPQDISGAARERT
ncbi:MAG: hypothetical protein U1E87_03325 [Alphaproteobacteria bacterium]